MATLTAEQTDKKLWVLLLLPPAIWFLQLVSTWSLSEGLCNHHVDAGTVRGVVVAVGAVAFAIAVGAGFASLRTWRAYATHDEQGLEASDRSRFLALLALCVSALTVLAVVLAWAPAIAFSNACGAYR